MSNSVKLSGSFEIEEPLEIDHSYNLGLKVGINSIQKHSNEDGTHNYIFVAKPEMGMIQTKQGKTVKLTKKGSQSAKLRYEILRLGLNYEATMAKIISNLEEITTKYN